MKKSDFGLEIALVNAVVGVITVLVGIVLIVAIPDIIGILIGIIFIIGGSALIYCFVRMVKRVKNAVKSNPQLLDQGKTIELSKKDGTVVWICPNCSKEGIVNGRFCSFCGESVDNIIIKKTEN